MAGKIATINWKKISATKRKLTEHVNIVLCMSSSGRSLWCLLLHLLDRNISNSETLESGRQATVYSCTRM